MVCVDASSPSASYTFTNSQINVVPNAVGGFDGADGGSGTVATTSTNPYTVTAGPGGCVTVLQRTLPDNGFLGSVACPTLAASGCVFPQSDTFSGITVTASVPGGQTYVKTDCVLDTGVKVAVPDPCSAGGPPPNNNNPTRAYMNAEHGSKLIFFFGASGVIPLFVIGDIEPHGIGANVNFWGSQWWKNNPMSLFTTKGWPSFKGFASSVDLTATSSANPCGTWTSRVGNSPPPPATIPEFVGIIVTNNVIKIGPGEGGGIQQIVIVRSDGGYGPAPGHDGNGPVVSIQCTA